MNQPSPGNTGHQNNAGQKRQKNLPGYPQPGINSLMTVTNQIKCHDQGGLKQKRPALAPQMIKRPFGQANQQPDISQGQGGQRHWAAQDKRQNRQQQTKQEHPSGGIAGDVPGIGCRIKIPILQKGPLP